MPVHDWTKVDAGLFHHYHQRWTGNICDALNEQTLPKDYFALVEQNVRGPIPDVLTSRLGGEDKSEEEGSGGAVAIASVPVRARLTKRTEEISYLTKTNRVTVRHRHGKIIAVIEIVSPGNKSSNSEFRRFVEKSADLVTEGIHLLVVDLFPPGRRDPQGIAKAIWDEFEDQPFESFPEEPLTALAIDAGPDRTLYVEPFAVGRPVPEMPLFLQPGRHVFVPLEATYQAIWQHFPNPLKKLLES